MKGDVSKCDSEDGSEGDFFLQLLSRLWRLSAGSTMADLGGGSQGRISAGSTMADLGGGSRGRIFGAELGDGSPLEEDSHQSDVPVKKSWVSVASKQSLQKFDFKVSVVEGKETIDVPEEIFVDAEPLWEEFLVGRFASSAPHEAKIHVIVNKIWNLGDKSIRVDVFRIDDTSVKFKIKSLAARQRVLRRGMWNICQIPMIVTKWTPNIEESQPEVKSMPLWVSIKNVPHSMFSWKGLSFLASPVGEPIRLHQETQLVTNFEEAKIFVDVDLSKSLPKSYYFNIKGEGENMLHSNIHGYLNAVDFARNGATRTMNVCLRHKEFQTNLEL